LARDLVVLSGILSALLSVSHLLWFPLNLNLSLFIIAIAAVPLVVGRTRFGRRRVRGRVLLDFLEMSQEMQGLASAGESDVSVKHAAAAILAATFDETMHLLRFDSFGLDDLRRDWNADSLKYAIQTLELGKGFKLGPYSKLEDVKNALRFRNHVLHAEWDQIDGDLARTTWHVTSELIRTHFNYEPRGLNDGFKERLYPELDWLFDYPLAAARRFRAWFSDR
jgi:hypothetical protein